MNNNKIKLGFLIGLSFFIGTAGIAAAQSFKPTSGNLPVPNHVKGAVFTYNWTDVKVEANAGRLADSHQQACAAAADFSNYLDIDLGTVKGNIADLRFNSYNVGKRATVNYTFGAENQVALNRIDIGAPVSQIQGSIAQTGKNGSVFLINPNGIIFGAESYVNVDSFMASTLNYKSDTLGVPGKRTLTLSRDKNTTPAGIVFMQSDSNDFSINTGTNAIFISNAVINNGKNITGQNGNVQLITTDGVVLKFDEGFKASTINPEDPKQIKVSTITPEKVVLPDETCTNDAIYQAEESTISGKQVEIISMTPPSSPYVNTINLQGRIEAEKIIKSDNVPFKNGNSSNNPKPHHNKAILFNNTIMHLLVQDPVTSMYGKMPSGFYKMLSFDNNKEETEELVQGLDTITPPECPIIGWPVGNRSKSSDSKDMPQ